MAQLKIYTNANPTTKADFPFLLDVQSDLMSGLDTRMVIPIASYSSQKYKSITKLTPLIEIKGKRYIALTPLMAGVAKQILGPEVADIANLRFDIIAAIDLLVTGF